jgi:NADPH:quinone reductase-like Zn-dependent oxidoreductase
MRAVAQQAYGAPEVLEIVDIESPSVGTHDVLVEVRASAVTQGDRRLRAADFPGFLGYVGRLATGVFGPRHRVPGTNFAGEVVAVGAEVTRFAPGDDVFGAGMHGAHAERVCVAEASPIASMPPGMGYAELADMAYGAATALTFLRDLAEVEAGDGVLVVGAAGGVGRYAVQLAKHLGAEVTAVCHGDDAALVRELGADAVIDYTTVDFTASAATWDVIVDTSGTARYETARGALTDEGRFLGLIISLRLLFYALVTRLTGGRRAIVGVAADSRDTLEALADVARQGALRALVDRRYPLERIRDAHRRVDSGEGRGSVIVTIAEP